VSPERSLRRSRIGWGVPVFGMPVMLGLSAVLAGTKVAPPGIGIIAFFWSMVQVVWASGPSVTATRRQRPQLDRDRMLMTGRTWNGYRTLNLAQLSHVRRVKYTLRGEYGKSRVDYLILIDRAGVRLPVLGWDAAEPVEQALTYQHEHGLPQARMSLAAAMGLGRTDGDKRLSIARSLLVGAGILGYLLVLIFLIAKGIPSLGGYHGG
jgi:hypothetical protein